jgi:uncharacterized damage-inducible protein DinB
MDPIRFHRSELQRSLHGPVWHGPALLEALGDVTPEEALARPFAGVHSIAELALHSLAWIEEVTRRLGGGAPSLPARGDWPEPGSGAATLWGGDVLGHLAAAGDVLDEALRDLPAERLDEMVGGQEYEPAIASGVSYATMLGGLAQHNAYHGGQISLLKHALRRAGSPAPGAG